MKFFATLVLIFFALLMMLVFATTFAHAGGRRCVDDHLVPVQCPSEYNNYNPDQSTNRHYKHHERRWWRERHQRRHVETYYYDEWDYEPPRRRMKFKPRLILRFSFD
ncbi:MAG: hypothetical protein RLZZ76_611 [Candidatus Parcubacteria bacterium]